jgi:hypothetical protein
VWYLQVRLRAESSKGLHFGKLYSLGFKYENVEVTDNQEHSSLLSCSISDARKKFYSTDPGLLIEKGSQSELISANTDQKYILFVLIITTTISKTTLSIMLRSASHFLLLEQVSLCLVLLRRSDCPAGEH